MGNYKERLMTRLLAQQTYYNLQTWPLIAIVMSSFFLLAINIFYIVYAFLGYFAYLVFLKYLKMSYEERFKIYRFIQSIVYDIDFHKPIAGYIDIDVAETYPIELSGRDKRTLEIAQLSKSILDLKDKKANLIQQFILLKSSTKILKQTKKKKKKDKYPSKDKKDNKIKQMDKGLEEYSKKLIIIQERIGNIDDKISEAEIEKAKLEKDLMQEEEEKTELQKKEQEIQEKEIQLLLEKIKSRKKVIRKITSKLNNLKIKKIKTELKIREIKHIAQRNGFKKELEEIELNYILDKNKKDKEKKKEAKKEKQEQTKKAGKKTPETKELEIENVPETKELETEEKKENVIPQLEFFPDKKEMKEITNEIDYEALTYEERKLVEMNKAEARILISNLLVRVSEIEEKIEEFLQQKEQVIELMKTEEKQEQMIIQTKKQLPEGDYKFYRSKLAWSDIYKNEKEIIFILPSTIDETLIFTNDYANYSDLYINVPNHSIATFIEVANFKGIPYLLCVCSSWHIKESQLTKLKKEIAEKLTLSAKLAYLADEVSIIHYEYETLKYDNYDLENRNTALMNEIMKMDKRHKEHIETLYRLQKLSFDLPPRRLYAMTITGWVLMFIFLGLFLFALFGLFPTIIFN